MSRNRRAKKATKATQRKGREAMKTPYVVEMPRPWWKTLLIFCAIALLAAGWMALSLLLTGLFPDPVLAYVLIGLPGVVSMALRPIPARRQVLRWLAVWGLFWLSLPIAASAIYTVGTAWVFMWAWVDERDLKAKTPANSLLRGLRALPQGVRAAWRASRTDDAGEKSGRSARARKKRSS